MSLSGPYLHAVVVWEGYKVGKKLKKPSMTVEVSVSTAVPAELAGLNPLGNVIFAFLSQTFA